MGPPRIAAHADLIHEASVAFSTLNKGRERVLEQQLRDGWRVRERAVPVSPVMNFTSEGLVLGAGTVLLATDSGRALKRVQGQEIRILALLGAAYGKAVSPAVLGNIERAAKAWRDGDECLAYMHLAHSGLHAPRDVGAAAYRLFVAENAIKAGLTPRAVLRALGISGSYLDAIEKTYNPTEPRVPAGSGRTSGEWTASDAATTDGFNEEAGRAGTRGSSVLGRMPAAPSPNSFLGDLTPAQAAELGVYALRVGSWATLAGAAAAVFGLLFLPSPNELRVEGDVPQIPGLRYSWNRDESQLHLTYDRPGGAQRTFALHLDGDDIRDEKGRIVGRIIGGNRIVIDTIAVLPDLVNQNEPRLCPEHAPDVAGSDQGKPYEQNRARQYEDFIKLLINPPPVGPTPSGFVYYLSNPENGGLVSYDDCKKANGILFEIKGEGFAKLTKALPDAIAQDFLSQASRQVAASGGRPIVWIFAEEEAAQFARRLFDDHKLYGITVGYIHWTRSGRK